MKNYVIIGNSIACIGAVEGIRQIDKESSITIISKEPYFVYSRPLISYLLNGKTTEEKMKYRDDDFYIKNNCKVLYSIEAKKIDKDNKTVNLSNNETVKYDKLLIATGSIPFIPPMKGLETVKKVFNFYTLDDAKTLDKAIHKDTKVLIIGAGLIGLKCAEGIRNKVDKITVIDMAGRILSSILDDDGAKIVQKHLENNGLSFKLSTSAQEFQGNTAILTNGEKLDFDILIVAIGVRPNLSLFKDAGGLINRGIITDNNMKTSIEDIYSAGDCAEGFDVTVGSKRVLALLPSAYKQGECAGINMAGGIKNLDNNMPMNAIGFFGLHMMTAGSYEGEAYIDKIKGYKKLFYKDNVLKGFILIDNIERAGIYTSLIRNKKPLDEINFELICKKPALAAFAKTDRKIFLGGAKNDN